MCAAVKDSQDVVPYFREEVICSAFLFPTILLCVGFQFPSKLFQYQILKDFAQVRSTAYVPAFGEVSRPRVPWYGGNIFFFPFFRPGNRGVDGVEDGRNWRGEELLVFVD